jgi:hypothetical protein
MSDDRLASALDDCLERLRAGATVDECLDAHTSLRRELEPLLSAALRLSAVAGAALPDDRRAVNRARLMASLGRAEAASARQARGFGWRRLIFVPAAAAAIVAALVIGLSTTQAPDRAEAATVLTILQGDVRVETSQGARAAMNGMRLHPGDRIITAVSARAVLTFADGSTVTLDSDTVVVIRGVVDQSSSFRVTLDQSRGTTWTHLPPAVGPSQVEIDTPNARVQAPQEALFSTTVDRAGRTQVGAQTGALEVSSGNQTAAVSGGQRTTVDAAGVVGPASAAPRPPRELVVRVAGPVYAFITAPDGATIGTMAPGLAVNQVAGASAGAVAGQFVVRIPDPKDGAYKIGFKGTASGDVAVQGVIGAGSDTANLSVLADEDWTLGFTLKGDNLSFGQAVRIQGGITPANVTIPDRVIEKAKATAIAASSVPTGGTPSPTPSPSRTPDPTKTPRPGSWRRR